MTAPIDRRTVLLGLAAGMVVPSAVFADVPVGSARVIVEMLAFRQPGALPRPVAVPPLPNVATIPGRVELLGPEAVQLGSASEALARRGGMPGRAGSCDYPSLPFMRSLIDEISPTHRRRSRCSMAISSACGQWKWYAT